MADRWTDGETVALIRAWREVRNRRRDGETDMWLPAIQRSRARSTRRLATDDWRAITTAVQAFRTDNNFDPSRIRKPKQCQRRVKRLQRHFGDEQLTNPSWHGFIGPVVRNRTAGWRRLALAADAMEDCGGDEGGGVAAGGQARRGSAVAEDGSAAAEVTGVTVVAATENAGHGVAVEVKMEEGGTTAAPEENAGDGVAVEVEREEGATTPAPEEGLGSGATTEDPPSVPVDRSTAAATDFLGVPIPKKRRTGASASTSAAGAGDEQAPSVKEELVRAVNACRARLDEGRAPTGVLASTAAEMSTALIEAIAAESKDVAVVTLYREVTMHRIDLQRQMVAALAAAMGGAAAPEPRT